MPPQAPKLFVTLTGKRPIDFIMVLRSFTGQSLAEAKDLFDRSMAGDRVAELPALGEQVQRCVDQLFRSGTITEAHLVADAPANQPLAISPVLPTPPPPPVLCPNCNAPLKHRHECLTCPWLATPTRRDLWNTAGPCSRCGFAYRFDGQSCSHCPPAR